MKPIIIIFLLCIFLFQACQNQQKRITVPEVIQIQATWEEIDSAQVIPFDLLFDSLEVVNTPDISKIPLNYINRVISAGDYLAAITSKSLVVMHRRDTLNYIYNKEGRGPGEYYNLEDILFDEAHQKLLLLTGYPNQIFTLDLQCNFISSYPLPTHTMWERMFFHKGNLYMFGELYYSGENISYDVFSKFSNDQLSAPIHITKRTRDGSASWYWQLADYGEDMLIALNARDSLFILSDTLSVKPIKLEFTHEQTAGINKRDTETLMYKNEHYMILNRAAHKKGYNYMKYFLYNFENKQTSTYLNIQKMGNFVNFDKENLYFTITPSQVLARIKEKEKNLLPSEQQFYKKVFDLLHTCSEDDNPIILRMHVKQK